MLEIPGRVGRHGVIQGSEVGRDSTSWIRPWSVRALPGMSPHNNDPVPGGSLSANVWWLDDPLERYWVETLPERRPTLGRQLHAPHLDGSGSVKWRYAFVAETRPGDVVLHWLRSPNEHGFVGWSVVDGRVESRPIRWHARGTYGRRRPTDDTEQDGWWVPLRDYHGLPTPIELAELNAHRPEIESCHADLRARYGDPLYLALTLYSTRGVQVGQGYLFKWPAALNDVFPSLHGMGQLTAGEPLEPTSDRPTGNGRRSRRRREQRFVKAVELHAMTAATAWYTAKAMQSKT
jgi:hypothetical protein